MVESFVAAFAKAARVSDVPEEAIMSDTREFFGALVLYCLFPTHGVLPRTSSRRLRAVSVRVCGTPGNGEPMMVENIHCGNAGVSA